MGNRHIVKFKKLFNWKIDLGSIIVAILGLIATIYVTCQQTKSAQKIEHLRIQSAQQIEKLHTQIAESELDISRSQVATTLIPQLIKGTESERIISMIILENIGDSTLTTKIFQALALNDPMVEIRLQAIRALGRKGGKDIKPLLVNIGKQGKTREEREAAKKAEQNVTFRENLKKARAFFFIEKWEAAATFYNEAFLAADSAQFSKEDKNNLTAAKIFMETKSFKDAANKFNDAFSRFY